MTASTKEGKDEGEGGHTHEYFDKSLEDPTKKDLADLNDERANKTINDKKLNEKRSLDEEVLLKRNIKSADLSPSSVKRIEVDDLQQYGIIEDNDEAP